MAVQIKQLVPAVQMTAAKIAYYTAPNVANTSAIVHQATVCNTDAANQTFDLHVVPTGGTANDTNVIYKAKPLLPNETIALSSLVDHVIPAGSFIAASASIAAKLVLCVSGLVRSQ